MRKHHKEQDKDVALGREVHFTIRASEATIARITALLLLAEIPESREPKRSVAAKPLPWETPEETAEFGVLPPTKEELQDKATKLIQSICDTYIPGADNVKKLLVSFNPESPRLSAIPDDKLPVFVKALSEMPIDPALVPAYIEALHASESLI